MKAVHWIDQYLEEFLISVILVIISVLMLAQFVLRFIGLSLTWSDEACRYLFVWSVGIGISYASKKAEHLRMDIIPTLLPKTKKFFDVLCDIALIGASIWMIAPGVQVVHGLMAKGQIGASTHVPMWVIYSSMLVGFGLTIIRLVEKYIRLALKRNSGDESEEAQV